MSKALKQEKKVSKKLQEFINSIAKIGNSNIPNDDSKIYYSRVDGAYLTRVGMEEDLKFLLKRGITEQIQDGYGEPKTCCIGFNPIEKNGSVGRIGQYSVLVLVANVNKVIVVLNRQINMNLLKEKWLFGVIVNMP